MIRSDRGRILRWLPVAAVAGLLGAAMVAAVYANPRIEYSPGDSPATRPPITAGAPTDEPLPSFTSQPPLAMQPWELPGWLSGLLTGLCAAGILAVVVTLLWLTLRERLMDRRTPIVADEAVLPKVSPQAEVRAAVAEGLADLDDTDTDPRRAVIACWVRLEQAAAAAGIERSAGDTSTDLVARLLRTHLSAGVLDAFAAVYRAARFATHTVDEAMREQARAALRQLRDELATPAAPGTGTGKPTGAGSRT